MAYVYKNNSLNNYLTAERENAARRAQSTRRTDSWRQNGFARAGLTVADTGLNVIKGAGKGLEGIADTVLGLVGGIGGIFSREFQEEIERYIKYDATDEWMGQHFDRWTEGSLLDDSEVGRYIENIASGVGQMLPAVAVTMATGGLGGGALATQVASLGTMSVSAAGSGMEEALNDGGEYYRSLGYGVMSGAVEAGTEKLFGGLTSGLTGKGVLKLGKEVAEQGTKRVLKGAMEEGLEEVASEVVNPLTRAIYKGKDALRDYGSADYYKGLGETFLVGAGTGAVYGGTVGAITNRVKGLKENISAAVEANENIDKKLRRAFNEGTLTEQAESEAADARMQNLRSIERELTRASSDRRARYIKNYGLEGRFNADGTLKAEAVSAVAAEAESKPLDKRYYSVDARGREDVIREDLAKISEDVGESVEVYSGEMSEVAKKNYTDVKKALTTLNERKGNNVSLVVVSPNSRFNGVERRRDTIYMGADTFERENARAIFDEAASNGNSFGTLIHEYEHTNEGTAENAELTKFLAEDKALYAEAAMRVLGDEYGITAEEVDRIVKKQESGAELTTEELDKMRTFTSETGATMAEQYLGNEHFIRRLVAKQGGVAERVVESFRTVAERIATLPSAEARAEYKRLVNAERLYLKAAEASGNKALAQKLRVMLKEMEEKERAEGVMPTDGSYDAENADFEAVTITNEQNMRVSEVDSVSENEYNYSRKDHTKKNYRRKVPPRDDFATDAMQWAYSGIVAVGEQKTFYKKGVWVLLEKTDDGFVEIRTLTTMQRNAITKEIEEHNAGIREDLYTCIMRYKHAGADDTLLDRASLESQVGDGRVGGVYREKSENDRKRSAEGVRENNQREIKYSRKIEGTDNQQSKKFSEYAVATALYDALDHMDGGDDNLIKVSRMPQFVSNLFDIDGDLYIYRDHAYENTVSRERAIEEGRPTKRGKADIHFHDLGEDRMVRALKSIDDPILAIQTKSKDGYPVVIMMLSEYGDNGAPLYAVLSFYTNQPINGVFDKRPHIVATISPREWTVPEGGRQGWAELISEAVDEGQVLFYDKKRGNDLSVIAQRARLGNITEASLNNSIARFKRFVNEFKQKNKINYSYKRPAEGKVHKQIAEWEKLRVYEKVDAEKILYTVLSDVMALSESEAAVMTLEDRKAAENLLWEELNKALTPKEAQRAAERVADFLISRSVVKSWMNDPLEAEIIRNAENVLVSLKPYLRGFNLSSIKSEIKHRYDTGAADVMRLWNTTKTGVGVDQVISELNGSIKGYGFPITDSGSVADAFFAIHEAYTKAKADLQSAYEAYRDRTLAKDEQTKLRAEIAQKILDSKAGYGRESQLAKATKLFKAELWKADQRVEYMKQYNVLISKVDAFREVVMGKFENANTYRPDLFTGSVEQLKKIVRGGLISVKETRAAVRKLAEWYNQSNPLVGEDGYDSSIYEKLVSVADRGLSDLAGRQVNARDILEPYMHRIDLSGIKQDIKDMYVEESRSVLAVWSLKEGMEPITLAEIARELERLGIPTGGSEMEIFAQIDQMYRDEVGPLTVDDMKNLTDIVAYFTTFIKKFNKVWNGKRYVDADPIARKHVATINENKRVKIGWFNARLLGRWGSTFLRPETIAKRMDLYEDGFFTETLQSFRQGLIEASDHEYEMMKPVAEFAEKHKKYFSELSKRRIKFRDRELPADVALSLYMTAKRGQAQAGLVASGFTYMDGKVAVDVEALMQKPTARQVETQSEHMQSELWRAFSAEDREFIKIAEAIFNEQCKQLKYDTDMKTRGYSNTVDGYYYPIKREFVAKSIDSDFEDLIGRTSNKSFNKDTVKGARGVLAIMPMTEVLSRHVRGISQYAALSTVIRNYDTVYNLNVGGDANKPVSVASESRAIWQEGGDYFRQLLSDMQGVGAKQSAFLAIIRGHYATFQLGGNPKTWVTQLSSFCASTSILDWGSVMKGFGVDASDVDEYCVLAKLRDANNDAILAQANANKQGLLERKGKVGEALDKTADILMTPIGKVDRFVVKRLFGACQVQIEADGGAKIGTKENKIAAGKLLEDVIIHTQQNALATERSAAMRSQNEIFKALTMFSADGMNVTGQVIDALGEISALKQRLRWKMSDEERAKLEARLKGANKKARRAIGSMVTSAVFMSMIALLFDFLYHRIKDEDEDGTAADEMLGGVGADLIGNMLGGLPLIRDIYSFFSDGYEVNNYMYSVLNDSLEAVTSCAAIAASVGSGTVDSRKVAQTVRKTIYAGGQLVGIPTRNLYNLTYAVLGFIPSVKYSIDDMFYEQAYAKDIRKAIEAGDDAAIATITGIMLGERVGDIEDKKSREELNRLTLAGHEVLPRAIADSLIIDGEEVKLTNADKREFKDVYSIANDGIKDLVRLDKYKSADTAVQAKAIKMIYDIYYELACDEMVGSDSAGKNVLFAEAIDIEKLALIVAEAGSLTADTDKSGKAVSGSRKAKIEKYVASLKLTPAQKYMIMGYLGYANKNGKTLVESYVKRLKLSKSEKALLLEYSGY